MQKSNTGNIVGFWVAALAAAAYWMLVGWRVEDFLWRILGWSLPSQAVERLVATPPILVVVFLTFVLPPVVFAVLLSLLRLRTGDRIWAIPATGFLLVMAFMGVEGLIVEGRPLAYIPVSGWLDESWLALAVALGALVIGSLLGRWILHRASKAAAVRVGAAGLTSASS